MRGVGCGVRGVGCRVRGVAALAPVRAAAAVPLSRPAPLARTCDGCVHAVRGSGSRRGRDTTRRAPQPPPRRSLPPRHALFLAARAARAAPAPGRFFTGSSSARQMRAARAAPARGAAQNVAA